MTQGTLMTVCLTSSVFWRHLKNTTLIFLFFSPALQEILIQTRLAGLIWGEDEGEIQR